MTTTEYTPGPWVCHSGMVWKDGPNVFPKGNENGIPICRMDREPGNGTVPVERDANACLISAAPELLEACKALMNWEGDELADGGKRAQALAFAAIRKAEGQVPRVQA